MTGHELRARFLKFFEDRGHTLVPSSSLVPHNDPTLLFTNAGMNQFKDCFLGREKRPYVRAASSQKCVRAGGKHNDLENVGRTARHHTFFEMLGNFSFGDYFKKEAIAYAWEFLTRDLGLDKERLYVSVFTDDDEAADIWHEQEGVPRARIFRFGEKDNFWSMGDTGPCGPCTEIFWDNGPEVGCGKPECTVGCDCDRYMEIWNNVFMQFDRSADGTLTPLPKPAVDTGMGLERIATVIQGVKSNYDTDLLRGIIDFVAEVTGKTYGADPDNDVSMRVIADHSRATAFLIGDGVLPSNEGRGYVLRRIMRRAARHAKMLGYEEPLLCQSTGRVVEMMSGAYPELRERAAYIAKVTRNEEERFIQTLGNGLRILAEETARLKAEGRTLIPGEVVFRLYDTFGFPVDLTADIVEAEGFTLDEAGFESCMEEQRRKAREHWKGSGETAIDAQWRALAEAGMRSEFTGYNGLSDHGTVLAILREGQRIAEAAAGEKIQVVTSASPFYGESGGQVGDRGEIRTAGARLRVTDTQRPLPELIVHQAEVVEGRLREGDAAELQVDGAARQATARNHTATHILQAVLVEVLGDHVKQAGSLVSSERLRFDFTHFSPLTDEEISRVEREVNRRIRENEAVESREMAAAEAMAAGATALFGEKYGESVRVISVGDFSMELCGGTHAHAAGDIGLFKILQESGIAAGVRRIEAVTGERAVEHVLQQEETLARMAALVKSDPQQLEGRLQKMLERQRELEREVESLRAKLNAGKSGELMEQVREVAGVRYLAVRVEGVDGKGLRDFSDQVRERLGSGVVVLGSASGGKANLLVAVSKDLTARLQAGAIIKQLAAVVGGGGGGRPDLAQAGGSHPEKLDEALAQAQQVIAGLVSN
ncbi:alanine--tRNA ligase [Geoalkalibacter halelectricus]|uniref:Alanine--tRNA ligase n=1 Tax=Geoalkalibacter halelectricus TaxID=2847045 RepID=A0ABY5ZUM2_9BACT|nr:alanine--tRNA ligase [Geoalkalibacter halelectricus]UWZ81560.1 alanine--tRNA ligase [Geoalkalibacter halelectricus]